MTARLSFKSSTSFSFNNHSLLEVLRTTFKVDYVSFLHVQIKLKVITKKGTKPVFATLSLHTHLHKPAYVGKANRVM